MKTIVLIYVFQLVVLSWNIAVFHNCGIKGTSAATDKGSKYLFRKSGSGNLLKSGKLKGKRRSPGSVTNAGPSVFASRLRPQHEFKLGVQGAPFGKGQRKPGVELGPEECRSSKFIEILRKSVMVDVKDYGDISFVSEGTARINGTKVVKTNLPKYKSEHSSRVRKAKNSEEVAAAAKAISRATERIIRDGRVCLTLGGDHSIAIGTVHGSSEVYPDLAVLWIDAHADINTVTSSLTGNMHGMPLAFLIKELGPYNNKLPQFSWLIPRIRAKNVAYIGLRDVDDAERAILDFLGITAYSMKEIDRHGIRWVIKTALNTICPGNRRALHVSFDIDALDDTEGITTGIPVPGGLTLREGITILEEIHGAGNLVSMDLVEINPLVGNSLERKRTVKIIKHLLVNTFGYYRGGVAGKKQVPPPKYS